MDIEVVLNEAEYNTIQISLDKLKSVLNENMSNSNDMDEVFSYNTFVQEIIELKHNLRDAFVNQGSVVNKGHWFELHRIG
jgi:molybdenum cofactor biosynthesis enzyme MoaA